MTDHLTENARLRAALKVCEAEIDAYIRHEYPLDHPVQQRYRERDFAANPARAALATPAPDAVQEAGAEYAAGFAEGIRRAAELPAYDCDGDPCGAFDNPIFVKRDAILALTPSSQEASHDRT